MRIHAITRVLLAVGLATLPPGSPAAYVFELIAEAPARLPPPEEPPLRFDSFSVLDRPTINDNGMVAFGGSFVDARRGALSGIFVGGSPDPTNGLPAVLAVAHTQSTLLAGGIAAFGRPAIGPRAVAYRAIGINQVIDTVEQGLFRYDLGSAATTVIAANNRSPDPRRPNPFQDAFFGDPALNDRAPIEDVVFKYENPQLASGVIVDPLPGVQVVARNFMGAGPNVEFSGNPVINRSLDVAVNARSFAAPQNPRNATLGGTGAFDAAQPPRPFLTPFEPAQARLVFDEVAGDSDPSINNRGQIAVIAGFRPQGPLVVVVSPEQFEPVAIADTSGAFLGFKGSPSINDAGNVAFAADLRGGDSAIFVFEPTMALPAQPAAVVSTGDFVFGKQVVSLSFGEGSRGLNNANALVFMAVFVDGSQAIVRAVPVPIPEPAVVWLVLAGLGVIGLRACLGQRQPAGVASQRAAQRPGCAQATR